MKKSIGLVACAVIVGAGALALHRKNTTLVLTPAEMRSLHDGPNDGNNPAWSALSGNYDNNRLPSDFQVPKTDQKTRLRMMFQAAIENDPAGPGSAAELLKKCPSANFSWEQPEHLDDYFEVDAAGHYALDSNGHHIFRKPLMVACGRNEEASKISRGMDWLKLNANGFYLFIDPSDHGSAPHTGFIDLTTGEPATSFSRTVISDSDIAEAFSEAVGAVLLADNPTAAHEARHAKDVEDSRRAAAAVAGAEAGAAGLQQ